MKYGNKNDDLIKYMINFMLNVETICNESINEITENSRCIKT